MVSNKKTYCVIIPARYKSSRFPGKPLILINGKPMILRVADIAVKAVGLEHVYIATDDQRISELVKSAGFKFILTNSDLLTGTDRVAQAAEKLDYDIFINLQGDEPLVNFNDIKRCINEKLLNFDKVINCYSIISSLEDKTSFNIPKVVLDENQNLLYISRSLIPGLKNMPLIPYNFYKQVCIYAFSKRDLMEFYRFGRKSVIENIEDIEVLRFFDLNIKIKMIFCQNSSLSVDIPDDVKKVENFLNENRF